MLFFYVFEELCFSVVDKSKMPPIMPPEVY